MSGGNLQWDVDGFGNHVTTGGAVEKFEADRVYRISSHIFLFNKTGVYEKKQSIGFKRSCSIEANLLYCTVNIIAP